MKLSTILKSLEDDECVVCTDFGGKRFIVDNNDSTKVIDGEEFIVVPSLGGSFKVPTSIIAECHVLSQELFMFREMMGCDACE